MISFVFCPRLFDHGRDKRFSLWETTILALVAGCSFAYPVYAEDNDTLEVNEVVVAATRIPMPPSRLSAATTVLTQEDISRTPFRSGTQIDDL